MGVRHVLDSHSRMEKPADVPTPITSTDVHALVADARSAHDLAKYFATYDGRHFDALDGGGARSAVADRFTAADLIAVQMLSVRVPSPVCVDLLEGELGDQISFELVRIPTDVGIGSPEALPLLKHGHGAWNAWDLLRAQYQVANTITSKLLARKRPRLVPICDQVVACAIGRPANSWDWFQQILSDEQLAAMLDVLAADLPTSQVTPARLLDVIIWMRHQHDHRTAGLRCAGLKDVTGAV